MTLIITDTHNKALRIYAATTSLGLNAKVEWLPHATDSASAHLLGYAQACSRILIASSHNQVGDLYARDLGELLLNKGIRSAAIFRIPVTGLEIQEITLSMQSAFWQNSEGIRYRGALQDAWLMTRQSIWNLLRSTPETQHIKPDVALAMVEAEACEIETGRYHFLHPTYGSAVGVICESIPLDKCRRIQSSIEALPLGLPYSHRGVSRLSKPWTLLDAVTEISLLTPGISVKAAIERIDGAYEKGLISCPYSAKDGYSPIAERKIRAAAYNARTYFNGVSVTTTDHAGSAIYPTATATPVLHALSSLDPETCAASLITRNCLESARSTHHTEFDVAIEGLHSPLIRRPDHHMPWQTHQPFREQIYTPELALFRFLHSHHICQDMQAAILAQAIARQFTSHSMKLKPAAVKLARRIRDLGIQPNTAFLLQQTLDNLWSTGMDADTKPTAAQLARAALDVAGLRRISNRALT